MFSNGYRLLIGRAPDLKFENQKYSVSGKSTRGIVNNPLDISKAENSEFMNSEILTVNY